MYNFILQDSPHILKYICKFKCLPAVHAYVFTYVYLDTFAYARTHTLTHKYMYK